MSIDDFKSISVSSTTPSHRHINIFLPLNTNHPSSTASVSIFCPVFLPIFPICRDECHPSPACFQMILVREIVHPGFLHPGFLHPGFLHLEITDLKKYFLDNLHRVPLGETLPKSKFAAGYSLSVLVSCQLRRFHLRFAIKK